MTYVEGFVIPVPTANKAKFIEHARVTSEMFIEQGATRVIEAWQDYVQKGETTDFFGAVAAKDDEAVAFSFIEWADKAAHDRQAAERYRLMETDPRWDPKQNPAPFDGKRMIFGTFQPIVEEGAKSADSYIQGFVVPVPEAKKEAYRAMAQEAWPWFHKHGALRVIEAWPDDVKHGQVTDFYRTVKAEDGEVPVFSFIEWPSREVCQQAHENMMSDPEMKMPDEMPFDGKRMIFGGFEPVVRLGE